MQLTCLYSSLFILPAMGLQGAFAQQTVAQQDGINGFEGALNYEGCRLSPGTEKNPYGQITVAHDLTINQAIYVAYRPFL